MTLRNGQEALKTADVATEEEPDFGAAWGCRGSTLHILKRWLEAVHSYDKAIELGGQPRGQDMEQEQQRLLRQKPADVLWHIMDVKDEGKSEFKRKEYTEAPDYYTQGRTASYTRRAAVGDRHRPRAAAEVHRAVFSAGR